MKILLVNPEINVKFGAYGYQAGLAALSASAKKAGFDDISLLHLNIRSWQRLFRRVLCDLNPDVIGFYTPYNQYRFISLLLENVDEDVFVILGGPHPTIFPKCIEHHERVNAICVGEGDETFLETIQALAAGRNLEGIKGLIFKKDGRIIDNGPRPFIEKLDLLPFEDRKIFQSDSPGRYGLRDISYRNSFRLGRGCPYRCTYCSNHAQAKAQPGKYVRFRSVGHIIDEIKTAVAKHNPEVLYFQDDTFMADENLVYEFCEAFDKEVGLPFELFGRVDLVKKGLLDAIGKAQGRRISYGIESGDEGIREKVLGKSFSNQDVVEAFKLTKSLGIATEAFVMCGFPEETAKTMKTTAALLRRIQPDMYSMSTYFPMPGTRLYEKCEREGLLKYGNNALPPDSANHRDLMLKLPGLSERQFNRERQVFSFRVYGGRSFVKALLLGLYETGSGSLLLRIMSRFRKYIEKFLFRKSG